MTNSLIEENERLKSENERLRDHLMNTLTILDLTYVLPENMKQSFAEQSKIYAARAALQPKEGNP